MTEAQMHPKQRLGICMVIPIRKHRIASPSSASPWPIIVADWAGVIVIGVLRFWGV